MDWFVSALPALFWMLAMPAFLQIVDEVSDGDCPRWWVWSLVAAWPILMVVYTIAHVLDFAGVPFAKRMFRQR